MKKVYLFLAFFLFGFILTAQKLPFQGYLEESGVPVNGTKTFIFELPDYGWTETIVGVPIDNGIYNVVLGEITLLPDSIFANVSETPLSITVDTTNIGSVTLYKPLINGTSLTKNGESIKIKDSTGKLRGELLPRDSDGQLRLYGANDSLKVFSGGAYGGRFMLFDSLGFLGAQLRVTNKGSGSLYTNNSNHTNVGWFGGYGNDGFTQLISYDSAEALSGALLLGSFADGKYPEVYLEGSVQPNFGLGRFKVIALPGGEETAQLEINRSNGGGQARLSISQDNGGADPTGVSGSLDLFADSSPNFLFGSAGWQDHDLANMSAYGAIGDGGGWYYSALDLGVSRSSDGLQEFGFLNFQNNQAGASTNTVSLNGNFNETGAGGIQIRNSTGAPTISFNGDQGWGNFNGKIDVRDTLGNQSITLDGTTGIGSFQNVAVGSQTNGIIHLYGEDNTAIDNLRLQLEVRPDGFGSSHAFIAMKDDSVNTTITLNGSTGVINAVTVNQTSDKRYKKGITTLDNSLENTLKLRGASYYWKDQNKSQKRQIGVIAQEVEEVYPEFVHTNQEGYKSVNYAQMTAVLIEAIKELNAKVENLEKENEALTTALNETKILSEKIDKLEKLLSLDKK
ncbi:tail fiber domain-containing protein [Marivirga sp.]|uniref:tail fiber domain-containing protein n=1 Tax=Marivirga sp. TaxID=2018662 RepID=UPI0025CC1603|nr:tail fiber domain-containing protein [Marivirga sp.]